MAPFIHREPYRGPVRAVVLDWAGTAVDYGCMGPAAVFVDVFKHFGVSVSVTEARQFMGLMKKDHLRRMLALPSVAEQWWEVHGRYPDDRDLERLYDETQNRMVDAVVRHSVPIPGLLDAVAAFRDKGIRIGSTTGYTGPMLEPLVEEAARLGYRPDAAVCSTDVPAGRPYPWMCYANAVQLGVYPMWAMVKIGDTVADIEEGLNAAMWTIGVTKTGNELGLDRASVEAMHPRMLESRLNEIGERFRRAGAHYVVEGIWACPEIIDRIDARLAQGETPLPVPEPSLQA